MLKSGKKVFHLVIIALFAGLAIYYFFPEAKFPQDKTIDKIEVYKSRGELWVFSKGQLIKTYNIAIGGNPVGQKECEGDKKTPEGIYTINAKNPNSNFHKNLGISYPNEDDIFRARKMGKSAGGDIKIHGIKNGWGFIGKFQRWINWTAGCVGLTDREIDEIFDHTPIGTKIEIKP